MTPSSFTCHKALLGIPGTNGFFLRDPDDIAPRNFGGTGTNTQHPSSIPAASGQFAQKSEQQIAYLISELKKDDRITLCHDHPDLPIISFNISGILNDHVGFILARGLQHHLPQIDLHCSPARTHHTHSGTGLHPPESLLLHHR